MELKPTWLYLPIKDFEQQNKEIQEKFAPHAKRINFAMYQKKKEDEKHFAFLQKILERSKVFKD